MGLFEKSKIKNQNQNQKEKPKEEEERKEKKGRRKSVKTEALFAVNSPSVP